MGELANGDHRHEDEADDEHREDRLATFLRGRLDGEQVQRHEHGGNLPKPQVGGERMVDGLVAGCGAGGGLERAGVAAQPQRRPGVVKA